MTATIAQDRRSAGDAGAHRRHRSSTRELAPPGLALLGIVVSGLGILTTYRYAKTHSGTAYIPAFWASFLFGAACTAAGACRRSSLRSRRIAVLIGYGVLTMLPKFLMSVNGPIYFDEYGHFRHVNDMVANTNLLQPNSLIPITRYYPGLEFVTGVLHTLTGLSTWHSGQVVVTAAHCSTLLLVFFLAREMGLADRYCSLAAIIYSLNPSFLYFDTQFAYESLALPLALATVLLATKSRRAASVRAALARAAAAFGLAIATMLTHHVSSFVMCSLVAAVAVLVPTRRVSGSAKRAAVAAPYIVAAGAVGLVLVWSLLIAVSLRSYLLPHFSGTAQQLWNLVTGHRVVRQEAGTTVVVAQSHQPFSGSGIPGYERWAGLASPFIAAVGVAGGWWALWQARRDGGWQRGRTAAAPLLLSFAYFGSLPLVFTSGGGEIAHRSWGFSYVGVACLAALGVSSLDRRGLTVRKWRGRVAVVSLAGLAAVIAVGNVAQGENLLYRFPGPYLFSTDTRSVTPEAMGLMKWITGHLQPGVGIIGDRTTSEMVEAYTHDEVPGPSSAAGLYIYSEGDNVAPGVRQFLKTANFRYFVLDTRSFDTTPFQSLYQGYYPGAVDVAKLQAMGHSAFSKLIYSTDHYRVFQLSP